MILVGLTGFAPAISYSQGTRVSCYATARKNLLTLLLLERRARRIFTAVFGWFPTPTLGASRYTAKILQKSGLSNSSN